MRLLILYKRVVYFFFLVAAFFVFLAAFLPEGEGGDVAKPVASPPEFREFLLIIAPFILSQEPSLQPPLLQAQFGQLQQQRDARKA